MKSAREQGMAARTSRPHLVMLLALLTLAIPAHLLALDTPPAPTRWYTDGANLLSVTDATALDQKLKAFEERSGAQFLIYVFPTLGGDPLEDFTIRCAEKWKAGQKKYDNGLILFVAVQEKKTRIEVGYGLEGTITDAVASDILRNDIPSHFRTGDYAGGLNAAADGLIARIEKKEPAVPVAGTRGPARQRSSRGIDPMFLFAIVIIFFFFILPLLRRGGRRGGCGGCIPIFLPWGGSGMTFGGGGFGGGGGGWGGGGGGFSGGGGGFGGGGASGGW